MPESGSMAVTLAIVQESLLERNRKNQPRGGAQKGFLSGSGRNDSKGGLATGDLWKARQLKEYRRANGLCFSCGEKYTPAHNCKLRQAAQLQAMTMEMGADGGGIFVG